MVTDKLVNIDIISMNINWWNSYDYRRIYLYKYYTLKHNACFDNSVDA